MGIHQLSKLIKNKAPMGHMIRRLPDFARTRVAVDVSNYLYQFVYNQKNKKPNNHLAGFFQLTFELARAQILPVFILDGRAGEAKNLTLLKRAKEKQAKKAKIVSLGQDIKHLEKAVAAISPTIMKQQYSTAAQQPEGDQDAKPATTEELVAQALELSPELALEKIMGALTAKHQAVAQVEKQIIEISPQVWQDLAYLFEMLGVPVLQAEYEADLLAAELAREGLVQAVLSEDMDHLTFGAPCLIREFNNKRSPDLQVFSLSQILEGFDLSQSQFVDLCILCGCDYSSKIGRIGPLTGLKLLKQDGDLTTIVEKINAKEKGYTQFNIPDSFDDRSSRYWFLEAHEPQIDTFDADTLVPVSMPQSQVLTNYLMEKCRYRESTLAPKFKTIENFYQKISSGKWKVRQPNLSDQTPPSSTNPPKPQLDIEYLEQTKGLKESMQTNNTGNTDNIDTTNICASEKEVEVEVAVSTDNKMPLPKPRVRQQLKKNTPRPRIKYQIKKTI